MERNVKPKLSSTLKGLFSSPIPYEIRNPSGSWQDFFGTWESQKHDDLDTNCCWAFAGNEVMEDSLMFLWKTNRFNADDMKWFKDNGYIDVEGDFYLSRRFIPILSGVGRDGNDEAEFWRLSKLYGAIPNGTLPYTNNAEYFDISKITPDMRALGVEFLKRVSIEDQDVGTRFLRKDIKLLQSALFQSELQIGIPVPQDWNVSGVNWDGQTNAAHSVALYKIDPASDYPYFIYDQYLPNLKRLSKDYFITICTQAVVGSKSQIIEPVPQDSLGAQIWRAIAEFFHMNPNWGGV